MSEKSSAPLDEFKGREIEILNMMAAGLSNQEIAAQLFITTGTVRWYNKQIYSKLGTSRRTEAILLARKMGLIGDTQADSTPSQTIQHKLPVTTGPFIGRESELAELAELLAIPDIRLLSIIAAGGMGKSRLSLELGHLINGQYEHGAAFIDLTAVRNADDVGKATVMSLGLSITDNQSVQEVLFNYCREKELLLIFDNFEHVLSGASLLTEILEVAPNVKMIATSRERLNLRAETAFYLQPVTQDADTLFIEVATMMRPNIKLDEDELVDVKQIVELVGGLPLGLILAATWVDTLSVREIAEEIKASLDFLSAAMSDVPDRQHSIHAVVDPTWKRLNEKEQKAFMWVSVFRGGFTREHFQQVTGTSVRTLQTLLNRSLVNRGHGRRYDMHPLLRQYAHEKLELHGTLSLAYKTHLDVFECYARKQFDTIYTGHYLESLDAFKIEQDNFREALDWAFNEKAEIDVAVSLLLFLCRFWSIHTQSYEAVYYLEQALKYQQEGSLYYWLGFFQQRLGQVDSALYHLETALLLARESENNEMLCLANLQIGRHYAITDPQKSSTCFEIALAIARSSNFTRLIAHTYINMSNIARRSSGQARVDYLQQAMEIYETVGDLLGISITSYNLSLMYYDAGDRQQAKELCEYSLRLKQEVGDKAGIATRLSTLGKWHIAEEEFELALSSFAESHAICEEIGEPGRLVSVLNNVGLLNIITSDYSQAQITLEKGLKISEWIKDYSAIIETNFYLAMLYLLQGQVTNAKPHIVATIEGCTKWQVSKWLPLIAYANYLWFLSDVASCLPITALLYFNLALQKGGNLDNKYFLKPLIYRVQQKVGNEAWQHALVRTSETTIEQTFADIVRRFKIE